MVFVQIYLKKSIVDSQADQSDNFNNQKEFDMQPELDFNAILEGRDQPAQEKKPVPKPVEPTVKLTNTDTRQRQQSCKVTDLDKDLLPSNTKQAVGNFRVSLSDMLSIDKQDQSLENYKKQLLGNIKEEELKEDEAAEVEIIKIEVVCQGRPGGNIVLDFRGKHVGKFQHSFKIKQGSIYHLRVFFLVKFDLVYGLKFVNNVYKTFLKVQKDEEKMGTFAPKKEPQVFDLTAEEAPSGFLARGDYKGKALFLDNDGIVHCQFDYLLTIDKDW